MNHKKLAEDIRDHLAEAYLEKTGLRLDQNSRYTQSQTIFSAGQTPKGVFFVESGHVKIRRSGLRGEEIVTNLLGPCSFAGLNAVIHNVPHEASAVAVTEAKLLFFPKTLIHDLLDEDHSFIRDLLLTLSNDLQQMEEKLYRRSTLEAKQRLAIILLDLDENICPSALIESGNNPIPKKDIAGIIGVAPETLSRILAEFVEAGLVSSSELGIKVLDQDALFRVSRHFE